MGMFGMGVWCAEIVQQANVRFQCIQGGQSGDALGVGRQHQTNRKPRQRSQRLGLFGNRRLEI